MEIRREKEGSKLTIAVEGKINAVTARALAKVVDSEISGITELIFALKDLEYTSSAGLRQFLAAQQIMDKQGTMVIRNANETVMEIFEETRFTDLLNIQQ